MITDRKEIESVLQIGEKIKLYINENIVFQSELKEKCN